MKGGSRGAFDPLSSESQHTQRTRSRTLGKSVQFTIGIGCARERHLVSIYPRSRPNGGGKKPHKVKEDGTQLSSANDKKKGTSRHESGHT